MWPRPSGGRRRRRAPLNHKGHPAVEVFTMISPFEGGTMFRVILAEKRVYVIGVTGPIHPDAPRVEQFFESFDVTNPAAAKGGGNPFVQKDDREPKWHRLCGRLPHPLSRPTSSHPLP